MNNHIPPSTTRLSATWKSRLPAACPRDPEILQSTQPDNPCQDRSGSRGQAAGSRNFDGAEHRDFNDAKPRDIKDLTSLRKIIFNIARLPSIDQHWILRRLSKAELKTLNQYHGVKLLQEAQRFRTLKAEDGCIPLKESPPPLPVVCQQLAMKAPLYIAIIIEQGNYPWATLFLEQFDTDGIIRTLLASQVLDVKPTVKHAVFSEWEHSILSGKSAFEQLLDDTHG